MMNHPNRSATVRSLAQLAGYYVREGSYSGTTDDRLGRWYFGHERDNGFRPYGAGHPSAGAAWLAAIEHAQEAGLLAIGEDSVTYDDAPDRVTVHRLADGRWLAAGFDKRSQQYRSGDMKSADPGFRYAFANSVQGLADYGVRTYRSPAAAIRANLA